MTSETIDRTAAVAPTPPAPEDYWASYERRVMPRELLALGAVGITMSIGIAVAVAAFF
ncbi:hypothetical protein [Pseudoclavibacter sp. RFBG4]|uniref:hypothetical protein n=1 Tax=Pseudoclavibacter sp. RFBG4 TaxID=2080575 RepID=UPI0015E289DB|nr:hypothetical protein [Pseudoclavibacter sp. RFBG4]